MKEKIYEQYINKKIEGHESYEDMKCSEVSTSFPSRRSPSCKTASHRGKSRSGRWALGIEQAHFCNKNLNNFLKKKNVSGLSFVQIY